MHQSMVAAVMVVVGLIAQTTSTPPKLIKYVKAAYPDAAIRAGVVGVVTMDVTVGADGHVQDARVLSGDPLLQQAALDSVKQWLFTPATKDGVPVPARVTAEESFEVRGKKAPRAGSTPSAAGIGTGTASRTDAGLGSPLGTPLLSDEAVQREPFLLALGRAGVFQVGMPVDTVYHRIPRGQTRLVDQQEYNSFTPAIEIRLDPTAPQPAVVATYRDLAGGWRVWTLDVTDPRFRTADGLGVGSTFAQIRAVSPDAQVLVNSHGPFVQPRDRGLTFWFDAAAVNGHTVPDTAVVKHVTVGGGPLPLSLQSPR